MNLQGKNILLTGASSGIGYELAKKLSFLGNNLALLSRRIDIIENLADELNNNSKTLAYKCDVTIKSEVKEVYSKIKKDFGHIDIAILNSGQSHRSSIDDYKSDYAKQLFDTNVMGIIYFVEELLPDLISKSKGAIVGVSSLADSKGFPKSGFYCASKAAATILLESLRIELKPFGIKVVTVKPGFVKTPMTDKNEFHMPFLMSAEKSADIIIKGLIKEKRIIEFPFFTVLGTKILKTIPTALFEIIAGKEPKPRKD